METQHPLDQGVGELARLHGAVVFHIRVEPVAKWRVALARRRRPLLEEAPEPVPAQLVPRDVVVPGVRPYARAASTPVEETPGSDWAAFAQSTENV